MSRRRQTLAVVLSLAGLVAWGAYRVGPARGDDGAGRKPDAQGEGGDRPADRGAVAWRTAVEPRPLSPSVRRGLEWLVAHQSPEGGWGSGEVAVWHGMGADPERPGVGNTSIACLTLIRSGSTPSRGPYRESIAQGVRFVCTTIESPDPAPALVALTPGWSALESKLGAHADTYLACLLLAEVKGHMPTPAGEADVDRVLGKVIGQIERHVIQDNPFDGPAWASDLAEAKLLSLPGIPEDLTAMYPILANAVCGKALHRARQAGARVSDIALARTEETARKAYPDLLGERQTIEPAAGPSGPESTPTGAAPTSARPHAAHGTPPPAGDADPEHLASPIRRRADGPVTHSSPAGDAARDEKTAYRRSMLGGTGPVGPRSPAGDEARDERSPGHSSSLGHAGPAPRPPSGEDAVRDGEDVAGRMEPEAGHPAHHLSRSRGHGMRGRSSGALPYRTRAVNPRQLMARYREIYSLPIWRRWNPELYDWSATLSLLQDSANTAQAELPRLRDQAAHSQDPQRRAAAEKSLARIAETEKLQRDTQAAVIARLGRRNFLSGLGNNGGEECLSYLFIAESLAVSGGDTWHRWNSGMTQRLERFQNGDGSWAGSHCIIGRTFCTSTVLLTLMADRTPVPASTPAPTSSLHPR